VSGHKLVVGGLLAAMLVGCGGTPPPPKHTGSHQQPNDDVERQVLDRLDDWTGDQTIGGVRVHAEPPYFAASGSLCRWVELQTGTAPARRRLACKEGGADPAVVGGWFYAPDVLVAPAPIP